jgi:hypothetical protein
LNLKNKAFECTMGMSMPVRMNKFLLYFCVVAGNDFVVAMRTNGKVERVACM